MEEILKSLLHLGVGVVKTVEDGFKVESTDPQGVVFELINKGELADDESVEKVRTFIEDTTNLANEYQDNANEILQGLLSSLQNLDAGNVVADLNQKFSEIVAKVSGQDTNV